MHLFYKVFMIISAVLLFLGCAPKRYDKEAEQLAGSLSRKQLVGQMLMFAVPGKGLTETARKNMREYNPGGIILFGYNLRGKKQTARFIDNLQQLSMGESGIPLFISIDQEGGRVWRITDGVTQFPGAMAAGVCGDRQLVRDWGKVTGLELRRIGVNMNLAPVLDVNNNPDNPVINTRSFGSDVDTVSDMGEAYIRGMGKGRCIAVGKHFPGHGNTNRDSHLVLPVIRSTMDELRSLELVPFKRAIKSGVDCMMTAHIAFPEVLDSGKSATVSEYFLTDILRKELGFRGVILTDDMEMNAISKEMDVGDGAVSSIRAGADIVLLSSYGRHVARIVDRIEEALNSKLLTEERLRASVQKILELKIRYGILKIEEGTVKREVFALTEEEQETVKGAETLNRKLSRCGIMYHGDLSYIRGEGPVVCVTGSPVLRGILRGRENIRIARTMRELSGLSLNAEPVLWYHLDRSDPSSLGMVREYAVGRNMPLVVIATGNPFPAIRGGAAENMLISFSNTGESLRQVGRCLAGEFAPKTSVDLNLGFPVRE